MKKNFGRILAMTVGLVLLAGCGSASSNASRAYEAAAEAAMDTADFYAGGAAEYEESAVPEEAAAGSGTGSAEKVSEGAHSNRKLIRTVTMEVETEEFETLIQNLEKKVKEYDGYVENSNASSYSYSSSSRANRHASYTIRIPADKVDSFLTNISEQSNVTERQESVEDITLSYVDLESHKKALQKEEERLLSFMEEAVSIEELITIEDRLTEVRYQLESMESQLRTYDNQVNYSTVYIAVSEVQHYTPAPELTPGERIAAGFTERLEAVAEGFEEFGIGFVIHLPDILVIAGIIVVILLVIKLILYLGRKHRGKKENGGDSQKGGSAH